MLDNVKDIYMAKLELAKLEGADSVSNVIAKALSIFIQILASLVGVVTILVLLAIGLGFLLESYILGITIFGGVLILMVVATIFFRKQVIVYPLKNIILKSIYEDISSK